MLEVVCPSNRAVFREADIRATRSIGESGLSSSLRRVLVERLVSCECGENGPFGHSIRAYVESGTWL